MAGRGVSCVMREPGQATPCPGCASVGVGGETADGYPEVSLYFAARLRWDRLYCNSNLSLESDARAVAKRVRQEPAFPCHLARGPRGVERHAISSAARSIAPASLCARWRSAATSDE